MIKFLMSIMLIFLGLNLAEAKSKKMVANDYSAIPFNWETFQNLSKADQMAYLKGYSDFFEKIDSSPKKSSKAKTAFFLESFLILEAHAEGYFCFNGGLAYMAPSEDECKKASGGGVPQIASFMMGCEDGEQRCSTAIGLSDNNKVFCYKKNSSQSATRQCKEAAGTKGLENLSKALAACKSTESERCNSLKAALKADTEPLKEYCGDDGVSGKGKYKVACKSMQDRNKGLDQRAAQIASKKEKESAEATPKETASSAIQGRFCSKIEGQLNDEALKSAGLVDPFKRDNLWKQVLEISSSGACDSKSDLKDAIKKMGLCLGDDPRSSMSNDEAIRIIKAAVKGTVMSSSAEENSARVKDNEKFEDQFGMAPHEFRSIFCTPKNREEFVKSFKSNISTSHYSRSPVADPDRTAENPRGSLRGQMTDQGFARRDAIKECFESASSHYSREMQKIKDFEKSQKEQCRRVKIQANDDNISLGRVMIFNPKNKTCVLSNGTKEMSPACKGTKYSVGLINEDSGRRIGSECVSELSNQQIFKFECSGTDVPVAPLDMHSGPTDQ